MLHFAWPWLVLFLPLPWLVRWILPVSPGSGITLFLPYTAALPEVAGGVRRIRLRSLLIFALIWLLLIVACMRPQWLGEPQPLPTIGRKLILAVDVSGSMDSKDMAQGITRLQLVQQVAGAFIERRHGDRVGLILFGSKPYLQAPITHDLLTVQKFLRQAVVGIAGRETAIGDAIGLALKRLQGTGTDVRDPLDTVLILLTDGRNTAGEAHPLEAARMVAQAGLRVHTIGVGNPAKGPFGLFRFSTDLDEGTLKTIAEITGGQYFRATDADDLKEIYSRIEDLEPVMDEKQWLRPVDELFHWPLGVAFLFSIPAMILKLQTWN